MIGVEGFCVGDEAGIEGVSGKGGAIADDDEFFAGAGHGDVHAADVGEEADVAIGVATYHANANDIALLALEAIDCVDGYALQVFL